MRSGVDDSPTVRLPDFIIVGAMRCGTTSLSNFLGRQPRIGIARSKELHHFDRQYESGLDSYARHFEQFEEPVVGEATPNYLYRPEVPARIADDLPNVKLVTILREPLRRTQSHYWHRVARDDEPLPFLEALQAEDDRLADPQRSFPELVAYIDRSRYGAQLRRYRRLFRSDQMRVIVLEEIDLDPVGQLTSVLAWLDPDGPNPNVVSSMWPRRDNSYIRFRSQRLRILARLAPGVVGRALGSVNAVRQPYPAMDAAAEAFIRSRLREDRKMLEELLGRSVDVWPPL